MSQLLDNLLVFRVMHVLLTPIEKSDAFRLGIVDQNGKQIKIPKTTEEKDAFTVLNKVAFKLKNIIAKNTQGEKELHKLATSLHLTKECVELDLDPENLEEIFNESLQFITNEDIEKVKNLLIDTRLSFKDYVVEDAPVNSASATHGIEGMTPETLGVKKKQKIMKRKNFKEHASIHFSE